MIDTLKKQCSEFVEESFDELWGISSYIHENPEIAFEEKKACEVLSSYLMKKGFEVETRIGSLPTAFKAVYKKGNGPRIAVFAEYDALRKLGHACGHNLIATSALGCGLAVKHALENSDLQGSIEVYGTPAEEEGGGKIIMLQEGVFDGLDAVFLMHPTSATTRIGGACTSFSEYRIQYTGKSAHAESHPENGVNALDAANLVYTGIALLRQQLRDGIHVCVVIDSEKDLGLICDKAEVLVEISTMKAKDIEETEIKVENIAKGMALATGCDMEFEKIPGYLGRTPNTVLADICKKQLFILKEDVMDGIPDDQGGEDLGNVSRHIPICNLYTTIYPIKKISGHTDQFRELSISDYGKHCLDISSKAMAYAMIDLLDNPDLIVKAKEELNIRMKKEKENE